MSLNHPPPPKEMIIIPHVCLKLQEFLKPPATDWQLHHAKMQFARYVFCVSGIQIWLDGKFNNKLPFNGEILEPNGGLSTPWLIAEGTGAPQRCHESLNGCLHLDVGQMIGTPQISWLNI